ncbi:hypothetical protein DPSP01_013659 [Paraphaeosphaeria sporulosa]
MEWVEPRASSWTGMVGSRRKEMRTGNDLDCEATARGSRITDDLHYQRSADNGKGTRRPHGRLKATEIRQLVTSLKFERHKREGLAGCQTGARMTGTEMEGLTWCSSIDRDCNLSLWLTPPLMEWYVRTLPWGQPPAEQPHRSQYQALPCRASSPE